MIKVHRIITTTLFFLAALGAWEGQVVAQILLVPTNSVWRYLDTGANLGTAWVAGNFDDSAWAFGPAKLGYGNGNDATVVSYGASWLTKPITTYFRRTFMVTDPASNTNLVLGLLRDDGAVVYLNGSEVWRQNLPAGTILYTTQASTNVLGVASQFYQINLSPALLNTNANVLAVEIHQIAPTDADIGFNLFLTGYGSLVAPPTTNAFALYVATNGNDGWSGTVATPTGSDGPLATLAHARDVLRVTAKPFGAVVEVAGGVYPQSQAFALTAQDSGTPQGPIVWRTHAGDEVRISGGRSVSGFSLVTDGPTLARLDPAARGQVWAANLPAQGITLGSAPQAGPTWAQSDPGLELFFQDKPMTLARYPNEGWMTISNVVSSGVFSVADNRVDRWTNEPNIMVEGFWRYDWADQRQKVASINPAGNIISIATPYHTFGYGQDQWFYAYNILLELDQPGEWYLDRTAGMLYFWPPAPLANGTTMVSQIPTLLTLSSVSNVTFQGFTFEGGQQGAISITGGVTNCLKACTIRNVGKVGVTIDGSPGSGVTGCDIYYTGEGGVILSGGNRATLTPGGLYVEDSHIHHFSRWNPMYTPGLRIYGVGQRATHNLIHDAPHSGIVFEGNDQLIEFNEFHTLVQQAVDAGAIYCGRQWTARGNIIRYNYFHHIYGRDNAGCNGIYLDDQFSSALIYGNQFYDVPTAVFIGGGRDNRVHNNTFVNCGYAVHIDGRGITSGASGVALTNELVSLPYQTPPWSTRYPELPNILNEDPMAPRGNIISTNISWIGGWTQIGDAYAQAGATIADNLLGIDPRFVDTNHLDFRLQPSSPAFALGFQALPLDQIGPRTNVTHAPWPPTVTLLRPLNHATFGTSNDVPMEAIVSDPARVSDRLEFLVGPAILGQTAEYPYCFTWSNAPAGDYIVGARAVHGAASEAALNPAAIRIVNPYIPSFGVTLLTNNFSPGTIGNQPAGWFANSSSAGGSAALLVTDNTAPLSGKAMQFYGTSSSSVMIANFATTTLAATGDSIRLTVNMHHPAAVIGTAPYIGLYNNMGTPFTANLFGPTGAEGDDKGFAVQKTLNTSVSDFKIFQQNAQGYPHGYTGFINTSSSGITALSTAGYAMSLTLTRNAASGLDITATFGGYSTACTQASPVTFTFNEVYLMNGLLNGGTHNFDNVVVATTVGAAPTTPPNFWSGGGISMLGGIVSLTATGAVGAPYRLWASTNVAATPIANTWTLVTNGIVTVSPFTITDPAAPSHSSRFYLFSTP